MRDRWHGLYREGWGNSIVPDAFSHPAKFRPALIRRIYDHMLEEGWLKPGNAVLDSFAGVALGGLHAMRNGLHWVGVELEARFVTLGNANIDLWNSRYGPLFLGWGTAVLLQGDSRKLLQVLRGEVEGCVSSPPYAEGCRHTGGADKHPEHIEGGKRGVAIGYEAAVASPPYIGSVNQSSGANDAEARIERKKGAGVDVTKPVNIGGPHSVLRTDQAYGQADGQLGAMSEGEFDAAVSSPPYADSMDHAPGNKNWITDEGEADRRGFHRNYSGQVQHTTGYGQADGQLGAMPEGEYRAAVSSPPYEASLKCGNKQEGYAEARRTLGDIDRAETPGDQLSRIGRYSDNPADLGNLRGGFERAVSSPPWENVEGSNAGRKHKDPEALAEERAEGYRMGRLKGHLASKEAILNQFRRENDYTYGDSPGQLGQEQADTFWSAARTIVEQVYAALIPGGHAVWVTKAFVRNGERVDFPGQWRQLCEAVGFVTVHEHHAMLVEDNGTQLGFFEDERLITERKSFFRRLAERKGSPRIDWETVWCMEKPRRIVEAEAAR